MCTSLMQDANRRTPAPMRAVIDIDKIGHSPASWQQKHRHSDIVSNQMDRTMGNKIETIENIQFFQGISNSKINK